MEKEKPFIYIDTNFSYDEALMLDMAFRSFSFEIVGISTVGSGMSAGVAGENILGLNEKYDLFLPIISGYNESLKGEDLTSKDARVFFEARKDYLEDIPVEDGLYEIASDCGRLDILATGPLTNIAKALQKHEDLEDYISHIFISGGSIRDIEENFRKDPEAIDFVLNTSIDLFILPVEIGDGIDISKAMDGEVGDDEIIKKLEELDKDKSLARASLLLYLMESPEAFIFDEAGFRVDKEEDRGRLLRSTSRKKNYLVNRVNEDSFLTYVRAKLC